MKKQANIKTQIYAFDLNSEGFLYAEVENGEEGCFAIWEDLKKKYIDQRDEELNQETVNKVISLMSSDSLEDHERITLATTLDWVVIKKKSLAHFIKAFEEYDLNENLRKQKEILEFAKEDKNILAVAWNQNSKRNFDWSKCSTKDRGKPYNISKERKHIVINIEK